MSDAPLDSLPISVLMVTWNSVAVLNESLKALGGAAPPPAELIVIDNASMDGSADLVEAKESSLPFPILLERMPSNTGFAAGMNHAIDLSESEFVFLLNPDARVESDTIARLYRRISAEDPDVYAVGPKLLRAEGSSLAKTDIIDSTGIRMTRDGRHFDRGAGDPDDGRWDEADEVFGISGAAVLLRRAALDDGRIDNEVFDEDFFAYREDADLAWRMRGLGYRAVYEPSAVVYHQRRVTPAARRSLPAVINYHSVKNRFLLRIHHADSEWMTRFGLRSVLRDVLVIGACLTVEWSSLPAIPWLFRCGRRHVRRRRMILRRRTVPARALVGWFT